MQLTNQTDKTNEIIEIVRREITYTAARRRTQATEGGDEEIAALADAEQ